MRPAYHVGGPRNATPLNAVPGAPLPLAAAILRWLLDGVYGVNAVRTTRIV